jgi:hypothetical protein
MSGLIPDPIELDQWLLGEVLLSSVHSPQLCAGEFCVVHNPSDHHMRSWPLNWRDDTGIFERLCPCGIGHPDPDQLPFFKKAGLEALAVHGCCGHCHEEKSECPVPS